MLVTDDVSLTGCPTKVNTWTGNGNLFLYGKANSPMKRNRSRVNIPEYILRNAVAAVAFTNCRAALSN